MSDNVQNIYKTRPSDLQFGIIVATLYPFTVNF